MQNRLSSLQCLHTAVAELGDEVMACAEIKQRNMRSVKVHAKVAALKKRNENMGSFSTLDTFHPPHGMQRSLLSKLEFCPNFSTTMYLALASEHLKGMFERTVP